MSKVISLNRAAPADASKILKFIHKTYGNNMGFLPEIIDRFALPWVTDVICFGVCFAATMDGRLIGTVGLSVESYPWNQYKKHLQSQWLHILDDYTDTAVRKGLITKARDAAQKMGYDMQIDIPSYLHQDDDATANTVLRGYYFNGKS